MFDKLYSSSEVRVFSHVDGFYLQRVKDNKYFVIDLYSGPYMHRRERWEDNKTYRDPSRIISIAYDNSYDLRIFKTREEAVTRAIEFEKQFDAQENERIRRENFVEQKVWR